jgi:hypothetical protein
MRMVKTPCSQTQFVNALPGKLRFPNIIGHRTKRSGKPWNLLNTFGVVLTQMYIIQVKYNTECSWKERKKQ